MTESKSIGELFHEIDEVKADSLAIAQKSTERFESDLASGQHDLAGVVADLVYLLREHLSCHDCRVVDHTHTSDVITHKRRVIEVYAHQMVE